MNTYSRALKHISMKDVRQKHQQKLIEQKIQRKIKREERQYIQSVMETKKSDWRKELREQLTTTDVFFTNLPATGDVDLAYPAWNVLDGFNYTVSGGSVTITSPGTPGPDKGIAASFDSSFYSNLVFDVSLSGDTAFAVFQAFVDSPILISASSGTYSIRVPQSSNLELLWVTPSLSVGTVTISNLRFQRRTPISVFIPLDSPEAVSFIRTGSGDLSPEEKQKQVKEMLQASDEYVQQMYGDDFPGTAAVPPGESGDTPGVEIAQIQPFAQQQKGTTGVGVPDTKELPGPRPALPGKMNYPPEWTQWKNA